MEKPEDKLQNNRPLDEKNSSHTEKDTSPQEKEWDPSANKADKKITDKEKLKRLKGVRIPNDPQND